jgi:hypothetical protein
MLDANIWGSGEERSKRSTEPSGTEKESSEWQTVVDTTVGSQFAEVSADKLTVRYRGRGASELDLGVVRTERPLPTTCALAYFEVEIPSDSATPAPPLSSSPQSSSPPRGTAAIGLCGVSFTMQRRIFSSLHSRAVLISILYVCFCS